MSIVSFHFILSSDIYKQEAEIVLNGQGSLKTIGKWNWCFGIEYGQINFFQQK